MQRRPKDVFRLTDMVVCPTDNQRVSRGYDFKILAGVFQRIQKVQHRVNPRSLLVVRLNHRPRCIRSVRVKEHRLLGFGVIVPLVQ